MLLGLNLSFISSDALIYVLKNNINEHRRSNRYPEQTAGMQDQPGFFHDDPMQASSSEFSGTGFAADRCPGTPSTSGADSEISSEDEVVRLLNCSDHYAALGLSRYENIDPSLLKKEYRKKVSFCINVTTVCMIYSLFLQLYSLGSVSCIFLLDWHINCLLCW